MEPRMRQIIRQRYKLALRRNYARAAALSLTRRKSSRGPSERFRRSGFFFVSLYFERRREIFRVTMGDCGCESGLRFADLDDGALFQRWIILFWMGRGKIWGFFEWENVVCRRGGLYFPRKRCLSKLSGYKLGRGKKRIDRWPEDLAEKLFSSNKHSSADRLHCSLNKRESVRQYWLWVGVVSDYCSRWVKIMYT